MEVDRVEEALKHKDIVGAVQTGRKGFGLLDFKPYGMSSEKEKRIAVVAEVRKQEQEKRQLHPGTVCSAGSVYGVAGDGSGEETFLERAVGLGASKDQFSD